MTWGIYNPWPELIHNEINRLTQDMLDRFLYGIIIDREKRNKKVETSFSKMYLKNMYEESRHTNI